MKVHKEKKELESSLILHQMYLSFLHKELFVIISICLVALSNFNIVKSHNEDGDHFLTINILDFEAQGDGQTDDSKALSEAWEALCHSDGAKTTAKLLIPNNKTFLMKPFEFQGPCNPSNIHIQFDGKIIAPENPQKWLEHGNSCWLCFNHVEYLSINGSGKFDAKGEAWWGLTHKNRPKALSFNGCKNLEINGITQMNSPRSHISVKNCNNVTLSNLFITAPKDSPNTDGIVISQSRHVNILKSSIATGDDCIAIKNGSYNINVMNVKCGPGHGISVGSLGEGGSYARVEDVRVRGCSFSGTQNGARIKTWPGGSGFVRNIVFENIALISSRNPIIIDQHYCNGGHHCPPGKGKGVEVSNVTFRNFHGTSEVEEVIRLDCGESSGCSNIIMELINITLSSDKQPHAYCNNAHGTSSGLVSPPIVPCLLHPPSSNFSM